MSQLYIFRNRSKRRRRTKFWGSCTIHWSCAHNGMSKGHWRVKHRALTPTKKKGKGERKERGKAEGSGWRDTFQKRGWSDSHVSRHPFSSLSESGFSLPWFLLWRFLLPAILSRCAECSEYTLDRIETWSQVLAIFLRHTKTRENTSVRQTAFYFTFLEWHRCHRIQPV